MKNYHIDLLIKQYSITALWCSTDFDGEPLDAPKYNETELSEETKTQFANDCTEFFHLVTKDSGLADWLAGNPEIIGTIGHDFWLTRNHHGAGFWDGDYPEEIGQKLTNISDNFGQCDLYVGDDGFIYC